MPLLPTPMVIASNRNAPATHRLRKRPFRQRFQIVMRLAATTSRRLPKPLSKIWKSRPNLRIRWVSSSPRRIGACRLPETRARESARQDARRAVFQDQAMRVAIECAGFIPGDADLLRKSMATFKSTGGVSSFKQKLIMVDNGYERDFADHLPPARRLRLLRISGIERSLFCADRLCQRLAQMLASRHLLRGAPECTAHGLLRASPDRQGCYRSRCRCSARLRQCLALGLYPGADERR